MAPLHVCILIPIELSGPVQTSSAFCHKWKRRVKLFLEVEVGSVPGPTLREERRPLSLLRAAVERSH